MSDEHVVKEARFTGLKEMVAVGLDEAFAAFEEALRELTDEQVRVFPILERNNIAWIAMHTLGNLDHYACYAQSRERALLGPHRSKSLRSRSAQRSESGAASRTAVLTILRAVREKATAVVDSATAADLEEPMADHPAKQPRTDAYVRTIFHTMAHVRQIWLLRGALGLTGGGTFDKLSAAVLSTSKGGGVWPMQHW